MAKTLLGKIGNTLKNFWKILPVGSAINYGGEVRPKEEFHHMGKIILHSAYAVFGSIYILSCLGTFSINPIGKMVKELGEEKQIEQKYFNDSEKVFRGGLADSNFDGETTNEELVSAYEQMGIYSKVIVEPSRKPTQEELTNYIDSREKDLYGMLDERMIDSGIDFKED